MSEVVFRIIAALITACLCCIATIKTLGVLQQSGYQNKGFWRWLKKKDNMYFNRLAVLTLCLALSATLVSLCFSFLGQRAALALSAIPFFGFLILFGHVDGKYALKVPLYRTQRIGRLFAVYFFFTACIGYAFIALLGFLSQWNGSFIYALVAYAPFSVMPLLMPPILCLANTIESVFERARNKKFVERAGQVLDETKIIRIGVVGSYGKTSVKNILKTVLSQRYSVVETPASYNTPIGIAKTVFSPQFSGKEILIAEMGARKAGDIAELCRLVKPDYAVFTGVCEQHLETFGSLENVFAEKSEILKSGAKTVVCGEGLKAYIQGEYNDAVVYAESDEIENLVLSATETTFSLRLDGREIKVKTAMLGKAAAENMLLSAKLAYALGLTAEEIERGLSKVQPVAHRLQLTEENGIYILDDGYNCNPKGAKEGLSALSRFAGRKCVVTPGIVECGVLEKELNTELGAKIAGYGFDKVILVGNTLVGAVKEGYLSAGGAKECLETAATLELAQERLAAWLLQGDAVLFLNDLPDLY